jgi:L-ascorbate metabolism protein UlaG (beta-lactamase superfamily)
LIPIAPISPRAFMKRAHTDPDEGVLVFEDIKAERMMPIHFDTFPNSTNDTITEAPNKLAEITKLKYTSDQIRIIKPGEKWVIK